MGSGLTNAVQLDCRENGRETKIAAAASLPEFVTVSSEGARWGVVGFAPAPYGDISLHATKLPCRVVRQCPKLCLSVRYYSIDTVIFDTEKQLDLSYLADSHDHTDEGR